MEIKDSEKAIRIVDFPDAPWYQCCPMCAMDSSKSQTPYLLVREKGGNRLACGINCAVFFRKKERDNILAIRARDYITKKWVEIEKTFYVDESKLIPKGTMYPLVWCFASRDEAEKFVKRSGGKVLTYEEMLKILPCNRKDQ